MYTGRMELGLSFPHSNQMQKKYKAMTDPKTKPQVKDNDELDDRTKEKISTIQSIAEQEANRDRKGESIINKAESGKELSEAELDYISDKYPELYRKIRASQAERKMLEAQMKSAPDKVGVTVAFSNAVKRVQKTAEDDWELKMRTNQLADEYDEYRKSDEYKEKQDGPENKLDKLA